ncbi:uncharacterized protein LOC129591683 [Paramacrobiotus metropolitanus]|uniref:uncharacterized protein LOC129591683 n=1 Tax=Paramacrobiotus metropolitanus TaxID=2943436 RepID=UPI002445D2D6|nr:uncharacterized protein LOC129591683 [Paramacrobiotus metropolitanus]
MNRSILFLCPQFPWLYPSKSALPAYSRCDPHSSTYLFRLLSRGLFKSTSLHNLALVSKGLTSQLQLGTRSRPILERCLFPTIEGKSVAARGVASFPTEFPIGFAEEVQQFAFHLAELCQLQAGGDEATAVSFKDKDLLENVITGLKKGNYEGIRVGMSHLEEMLDALTMELRLHFGIACLEGLQKQRSRLQVVCSTLAAPGDMSDKSRKELNAFRSQNLRAARDIGQCLLRILQNCMPEPCLKDFHHLTLPWAQIGFQAFLAVTFDKDAAALLTALDKVITSARMLLSALDASFAKTEASSLLVQALHEVIVLTESEVFDTDVTFSVGECDAYTDADFSALFDYHPPCRTFVHCNWIYAIALTSTPHSRAAFGLLGELMRKLYVQGEVFEQEGERLEEIVDRFGCGRYYHKKSRIKVGPV